MLARKTLWVLADLKIIALLEMQIWDIAYTRHNTSETRCGIKA
jgi:hypothetical protein